MKSILVLAMLVISVAFSGATFAGDDDKAKEKQRQEQQEKAKAKAACTLTCAKEKNDRDSNCPVGGEYTDVARAKCLQSSSKAYTECVNSCNKGAGTAN